MMSNHVYTIFEIVGASTTGTDNAIRNAVETAAKTTSVATRGGGIGIGPRTNDVPALQIPIDVLSPRRSALTA